MAYYSNSGTQIYSGAAGYGLLQSFRDGSLGAMATVVDGSEPVSSGAKIRTVYSTYSRRIGNKYGSIVTRKKLPAGTPMWKVLFRVDNGKYGYVRNINDAIRAQGGVLLDYKKGEYGTYYGSMYFPRNLYTMQWFGGVPVTIIGSTRATTSDKVSSLGAGPLQSYQDGSLGAGPLQSYQDGSLGADPSQAYHDGVLGGVGGSLQAFQDGSLGMLGSGPLMSYRDGSLGYPLTLETSTGVQTLEDPVIIRHGAGEYITATGEYFSGTAGCSSCGVGQVSPATIPVLNLSDPQVMKELKTAMLVAPWILVNLQSAADQVEADALDPNWTPFTTQIAEGWMQGYGPWMVSKLGGTAQAATAEEYTAAAQNGFVPPEQIPNALGVQAIFSVLEVIFLGEDGQGKNALMTPEQFPNLVAFVGAVRANNGQGEVAFAKKGLFGQASAMQIGLGALVIGSLVYLAFGKKRRK